MAMATRVRHGRPPSLPFEDVLGLLDEFLREHGRMPTRSGCSASGFPLGRWLSRQVTKNTNGTLAEEDYRALRARGVVFPHDDGRTRHLSLAEQVEQNMVAHSQWVRHLAALDEFIAEHGHPRMSLEYVAKDGTTMRGFLWRVRIAYRRGTLPQDQVDALNARGFEWAPEPGRKDYPDVFANRMRCLDRYSRETGGDVNPPRRYQCWHDDCVHWDLGEFLYRARGKYWAGTLSADQVRALEGRGVDWDPTGVRRTHARR